VQFFAYKNSAIRFADSKNPTWNQTRSGSDDPWRRRGSYSDMPLSMTMTEAYASMHNVEVQIA